MATLDFVVSTPAQLAAAIASINVGGANALAGASYVITIKQDLTLNANIPTIDLAAGASLLISGKGGGGNPRATVDGNASRRGFVVQSGTVTLDSLSLIGMVASGGAGGAGASPGGGGAGLGGAVFVGAGASVDLSNVVFSGDSARGGAGGATTASGVGAGGASSDGLIGAGGAGGVAAGFGGGGGAGAAGGFGGGASGGGGLGAGGDVFVAQGGTLTISGSTLGAGVVSGGATHHTGGTAGGAYGNGLFIQGDTTVSISNETVSGMIADQAGSGGTGAGALAVSGPVTLSAANTFTGGIVVAPSSVLTLKNAAAAGTGAITLSAGDELVIGSGDAPANAIAGMTDSNGVTIDLQGVGLEKSAKLNAANQLVVSGGSAPVTLDFAPAANYANDTFQLVSDGAGGTIVRAVQTTYHVASEAELNAAIQAIDLTGAQSQPKLAYTIDFTAGFSLTSDLYAIDLAAGDRLTINGGHNTLDGGGLERGFFVYAGQVTIANLTIANAVATGGAGGAGALPGGGGAGLGGGLFIGSQGSVKLTNVSFRADRAVGGAGGAAGGTGWGGGGGLGGAGGAGGSGGEAGGGGVGSGAVGGTAGSRTGGAGILLGAGAGGAGAGTFGGSSGPGSGGANGGGGGWGAYFSGSGRDPRSTPGEGGAGGVAANQNFGGGAGSGRAAGLGGGGAAYAGGANGTPDRSSGIGGFGGGGAAGSLGGFGAGAGGAGGGGGLGAGGAIFVQAGGSLTYGGGAVSGGSATGGAGSGGGASGQGLGAGLFTQGGVLTLDPGAGRTLTLSNAIVDGAGAGGTGSTALDLVGAGAVTLAATNAYSGGTTIDDAGLTLKAPGAAGSGVIDFAYGRAATLTIGAGDVPTNVIADFAPGDSIVLLGVGAETTAKLGANNVLTVSGGSKLVRLNLDPTQDYSGETFAVAASASVSNASVVTVSTAGNLQPPHIAGAGATIKGTDNAALTPLAGVSVEDVNPGAIDTATLSLSSTANGLLSNLGTGSYDASTGVYSVTGNAAAVTAALDALIFTPAAHELAPGQSVSTVFSLSVSDGALTDKASQSVSVTAVNTPPTIGNLPGTLQPAYFTVPYAPFAGTTVADPDLGAVETATITLSGADLNGTLSLLGPVDGVSLTETAAGSGVYDLSAGSPAAIAAALDAIQFTPTFNASGFTITTMSVAVSDGTATATGSTSVLAGAPVIAGAVSGQTTLDTQPIDPFTAVSVTDSPEFLSDQLTILLIDPVTDVATYSDANGLLSGAGLTHTQPGVYTLATGTPAQLTTALHGVTFTPTAHQGAAGTTIDTGFELSVFNGASTSNNYGTGVLVTETAKALAAAPLA